MPQTLTEEWKESLNQETLDNYDVFVTRLGNLTLTNYNSELSNKSFSEKKKTYEHAGFYYTRELAKYQNWTAYEINKRSKTLAEQALQIWPFPKQYQKKAVKQNTLYTLDEDLSQYAYTKPYRFYIADQEYAVSAWSELIPIVCEKLIAEDKETFLDIISSHQISAIVIDDGNGNFNNNAFKHFKGNLYIRNQSSYGTLNTIIRLVNLFDTKTGNEDIDSIMFSVR